MPIPAAVLPVFVMRQHLRGDSQPLQLFHRRRDLAWIFGTAILEKDRWSVLIDMLMCIGEGTNEMQRMIIAKQHLKENQI